MISTLKTTALAGALALSAGIAGAATVTADYDIERGNFYTYGTTVQSGDTLSYTFYADRDMRIEDFVSVSATGGNEGKDLRRLTFGYKAGDTDNTGTYFDEDEISDNGGSTAAKTRLDGFILAGGESFDFIFNNEDGDFGVSPTVSFRTAAVPLPATGFLLLTAVAGGAAFGRRRKKTA